MSETLNMNAKENNTATTKMDYLDALCILGTSKWIIQKNNSRKSVVERSGITIDPVEYVQTLYEDAKVIAEFIRKYGVNLTPDDEWISVLCDLALTQCYSDEKLDGYNLTPVQQLFCEYIALRFYYGNRCLELMDTRLTLNEKRATEIALEVLALNGEDADYFVVEDWLKVEDKVGHEITYKEFDFIYCQATPRNLDEESAKALDEIYAGKRPAPMTVAQLIAAVGADAKIYQQDHGLINKSLFWDDVYVKKLYVSPLDGEVIFSTYSL